MEEITCIVLEQLDKLGLACLEVVWPEKQKQTRGFVCVGATDRHVTKGREHVGSRLRIRWIQKIRGSVFRAMTLYGWFVADKSRIV
jgi:hypothetical protein